MFVSLSTHSLFYMRARRIKLRFCPKCDWLNLFLELLCMCACMYLQMMQLRKSFMADITIVRPLSCMCARTHYEMLGLIKTFMADITRIRFISCMRAQMYCESTTPSVLKSDSFAWIFYCIYRTDAIFCQHNVAYAGIINVYAEIVYGRWDRGSVRCFHFSRTYVAL